MQPHGVSLSLCFDFHQFIKDPPPQSNIPLVARTQSVVLILTELLAGVIAMVIWTESELQPGVPTASLRIHFGSDIVFGC